MNKLIKRNLQNMNINFILKLSFLIYFILNKSNYSEQ
jgi:hypothetical protein